jgi:CRISPR/Cas system CMR subunit Cmr6 (Cas7 group RAMP superfamily)
MNTLNRINDIEQIKSIMEELNHLNIKYEISIIFGIPGQTIDSFQKTIKFVEENGCNEYKGYPLRLPQNSKMKKNAAELKIKEELSSFDAYPIKFVTESYSFTRLDWEIMYSFAYTKENKEDVKQAPIPIEFIPIMQEITYNYFLNKKRNKIIQNIDNGSLLNSNEEKNLNTSIYECLCKNDISKVMLLGTGADNFAHAINEILSEKPIRELCIKDNNFALQIAQYILGFITKTQQHISEIDNPFENEEQLLLEYVSSTSKNFEESWKITAPFIQLNYDQLNLDTTYFYNEFQKSLSYKKETDNSIKFEDVKKIFTDEWGKLLAQKELEWELDIIDIQRKIFCEELYKQIEQLKNS